MNLPLFFSSRFWISLADQFLMFVVPLMVFQITQSVTWSSLAFAIETIPRVAYTPFSGVVADFYSPFKMVRAMMLTRVVLCIVALVFNLVLPDDSLLYVLIALASLTGLAAAQSFISFEVLLPNVLKDVPFAKVQSWNQSVDKMAVVSGPLLAAFFVEFLSWEYVIVAAGALYFLGHISFSYAARNHACAIQQHSRSQVCQKYPNFKKDLVQASSVVYKSKKLWRVIGQTALVNLVFGGALATVAALVSGKFQMSPKSLGFLQMMGAATSIAVLYFTTLYVKRMSLITIGRVSFFALCAGGVGYSISGMFWLFFVGYIMIIGFDSMFNVYIRTVRQQIIPAKDYGKATGIIVFLNNITKPVAGLIIAAGSQFTNIENVLLFMTVGVAVIGSILFISSKAESTDNTFVESNN